MTIDIANPNWTDADRREQDHLASLTQDDMARLSAKKREPAPPAHLLRDAGHHWLEIIDSDDRVVDLVVMQWQPGIKRWCYSGYCGSGRDIDSHGWRYVAPCPLPDGATTNAVERQAYEALLAERGRWRERVEALEGALLIITDPIEGKPLGNPWDFYNDVRKVAAEAIGIPFVHQQFD